MREDDYDDCVSRVHYAAFHCIKAFLIAYEQSEGENQVSYRQLFRTVVSIARRYSWERRLPLPPNQRSLLTALEWLHNRRDDADYGVGLISDRVAQQAFRFSRELITVLKEQINARQS